MGDLSLKGVTRKYRHLIWDLMGRFSSFPVGKNVLELETKKKVSLRKSLEEMAREVQSAHYEEDCGNGNVFGVDASFVQIWTHIIVPINLIRLAPPTWISDGTMSTLRATWYNAIKSTWSKKWGCARPGEVTCKLTFEVAWVGSKAKKKHDVYVGKCFPDPDPNIDVCRSNAGLWFDNTDGSTASHEFGHILGLPDEYQPKDPTECPGRNPVNTGTIMDSNDKCFPPRLMNRFANNIGSAIVAIPDYNYDSTKCT